MEAFLIFDGVRIKVYQLELMPLFQPAFEILKGEIIPLSRGYDFAREALTANVNTIYQRLYYLLLGYVNPAVQKDIELWKATVGMGGSEKDYLQRYLAQKKGKYDDFFNKKHLDEVILKRTRLFTENLRQTIDRANANREFLRNFYLDLPNTTCCFPSREEPIKLVKIEFADGESHHGGKQVAFLTLQDHLGTRRVVYKPRPITIDAEVVGEREFLKKCGIAGDESLVERINHLLPEGSQIGSYPILPRTEGGGETPDQHYGYSQMIPHFPRGVSVTAWQELVS